MKVFDKHRNGCLDSTGEVLRFLGASTPRSCDRTLEIGCGTGYYARQLQRLWAQAPVAIGLDRSLGMLSNARRPSETCRLLRCLADAESMPFAAGVFELAFAVKSLHQVPNRRRLFQEIDRVLIPGALLVIVTPSQRRLSEFPLFAANATLAEHQMSLLPTRKDLLAEMRGTQLTFRHEEAIRGSGCVSPEALTRLIRARFLSILFDLSLPSLTEVEENTSRYLRHGQCPEVLPYWQEGFVFIKEDSHEL